MSSLTGNATFRSADGFKVVVDKNIELCSEIANEIYIDVYVSEIDGTAIRNSVIENSDTDLNNEKLVGYNKVIHIERSAPQINDPIDLRVYFENLQRVRICSPDAVQFTAGE